MQGDDGIADDGGLQGGGGGSAGALRSLFGPDKLPGKVRHWTRARKHAYKFAAAALKDSDAQTCKL